MYMGQLSEEIMFPSGSKNTSEDAREKGISVAKTLLNTCCVFPQLLFSETFKLIKIREQFSILREIEKKITR